MVKRRVLLNAIAAVGQVLVTAVILFILYRFLFRTIGIQQLGVWSVVLATTSVAQIANFGLSASVVKFVAKYLARGEERTVADVIQTSVLSIGLFIGVVLAIAYPVACLLLRQVLPSTALNEAFLLLPYALLSLWMTVVAGVFQAGLDGFQRIDLRSGLLTAAAIVNLLLCFALVPAHGLMGVAYARVIQTTLLLTASWLILKRRLPLLPAVPCHWNRSIFREMLGYGLNFQVISISQMLYDPVTKSLLAKFGGLEMTGFYEMASRMVLQLRALLVSANQVLVPAIADLQERNPDRIKRVYKDSYRLLFYIALPIFSAVIAFIPVISEMWIGEYKATFVLFAIMLVVGWFANTLSAPVYFSNLGSGEIRWNTIGHVVIAISNLVLGWLLGRVYGGVAVVLAWVLSLMIGSLMISIAYHYKHGISIADLIPTESSRIALASLLGVGLSLLLYFQLNNSVTLFPMVIMMLLIFTGVLIWPVLQHPMRKRSMAWIADELITVQQSIIGK